MPMISDHIRWILLNRADLYLFNLVVSLIKSQGEGSC
jgi:hypothetical protein